MIQAATSDDNPMDHSPKIRSLLTGFIGPITVALVVIVISQLMTSVFFWC
jgi:hypothetical protein